MNRLLFAPAVALLACTAAAPVALAQVKAVAPAASTAAPAAPAKWVAPVKGTATIQIVRGPAKVVGKEIVSTFKIKNMSTGAINLLKGDQDWYDKGDTGGRKLVTSATGFYRKPFMPGEVIDFELRAPAVGKPDIDRIMFTHANGKIEAKVVKKFE